MTNHSGSRGATGRLLAAISAVLLGLPLVLLGSTPVAAGPTTLYAAPAGVGTQSCLTATNACTLTKALTVVHAGGTIRLTTVGNQSNNATQYQGPFVVGTTGTTPAAPVSIVGPAGYAILQASASYQPVLKNGDVYLNLSNLIVQDSGVNSPGLANNAGGSVTIDRCTFENNSDSNGGGAIDNADTLLGGGVGGGSVVVSDSTFQSNTGTNGGAINNVDGSVVVTDSTFLSNRGNSNGGAIANGLSTGSSGPAVQASLTVTGSTFVANSTFADGGAIDTGDQGGTGTASISSSYFGGNTTGSDDGGAIASGINYGTSTLTVSETSFYSNSSGGGNGGAIDNGDYYGKGTATVLHSTFLGNAADGSGAELDNNFSPGIGHMTLGGDVINGGCNQGAGGTWKDLGYNVGNGTSCFGSGFPHDATQPTLTSYLSAPEYLDDPNIEVIAPLTGNIGIGLIPAGVASLCPIAGDERGVPSPSDGPCDSGAVQVPGGAIVLLTASPLPTKPAAVTYNMEVVGYYGVAPTGSATIKDSHGGSCTIPAISAPESSKGIGTGSCAISGESAKGSPYTITAAYNANGANHHYGKSSASIVERANVASSTGTVSITESGITVKATGGAPGTDTLTEAQYGGDPHVAPLLNATNYFDVAVSTGAKFKSVTIKDCAAITSSTKLKWWSKAAAKKSKTHDGWLQTKGRSRLARYGAVRCLTIGLSSTSSPRISQLSGTTMSTASPPLAVSTSSLKPTARVKRYGRVFLHAVGGNAPYKWSLVSGHLPPGLALSTAGAISGTPKTTGVYTFTVRVKDTATTSHPQQTATGKVILTVHS